jgi:hypothetical protein
LEGLGEGRPSKAAVELYKRIARGEDTAPGDEAALEELVAWGLVAVSTDGPGGKTGTPVILDPMPAARRRRDEALDLWVRAAQDLRDIPLVAEELAVEFERSKWWRGPGSEFLPEPEMVNARIEAALQGARCELLTAQPGGPRTEEQMAKARELTQGLLDRGVTIRSLYRDTVRDDPTTSRYAQDMTARGMQFRTLVGPFQRCVIIDRAQAFISDYAIPGAAPHSARHVKDRGVVGFMVEVFDQEWRRAEPWGGEARPSGARGEGASASLRTTQLQREILLDAEHGVLQGVTAARLGISPRRLSAEIALLRRAWDAPTLPALVAKWVRSPDRALVDEDRRAGRVGAA